ncbi:60S ribosomal protein L23a-like [Pteronotus mesoamericanus]|uniref:60S ribosomal protein L23a-like n=1 Tax=Pteronotus mesoamericanus TaxID=1884717 RepID=UPI0023EC0035|nr:60S ribosomal protein L23a-like [Pteronotus parnellii mesoamericanus]
MPYIREDLRAGFPRKNFGQPEDTAALKADQIFSEESPQEKLDCHAITQVPLTTEAATKKAGDTNTLVFIVDAKANKPQIKQAVKRLCDSDAAQANGLVRPDGGKKACFQLALAYDALDVANKIGII